MSASLAAAAVLVSGVTMAVSVLNHLFTRRAAQVAAHTERNRVANQLLREDAGLLALHGVTGDELEAAGVTAGEVLYLAHLFEAGVACHSLRLPWLRPRLSAARRRLLREPKVRAVWRLFLADRLMGRDAFTDAVDRHVRDLEAGGHPPPPARPPHGRRSASGHTWRADAGFRG